MISILLKMHGTHPIKAIVMVNFKITVLDCCCGIVMTEATAITLRFPIIVKTGKWLLIGEMTSAGISTCSFFPRFSQYF